MTTTARLLALTALVLGAGPSAGQAPRAGGKAPGLTDVEFDLERARVAAAAPPAPLTPLEARLREIKRAHVGQLRAQHKYFAERVQAGLAREQHLLLTVAELRAAEAELAPTPSERALYLGRAVAALRRLAALDRELLSGGSGGAGAYGGDPGALVMQLGANAARLAQLESELARAEAAGRPAGGSGGPLYFRERE